MISLCLAVFGLAAVSWARLPFAHTLALEGVSLPPWVTVAQWSLFGLFAAWAALSFRRVLAAKLELPRLLRLAVVLQLCAAPALPLTSSDVFCNLAYGRQAALGHNPYTTTPSQLAEGDPFRQAIYQKWAVYPTAYGPAVVFFDVAAGVVGSLAGALAVFKLEMLAATLLALLLGASICRTTKQTAAFALLGCNPLLAWELSGQAHNDALLVLGVCAFLHGALRGRAVAAFLGLALALFVKPAAVPLCGLVLLWQLRRSPLAALAGLAGMAATGALLYAPFWAGPVTLAAILRELRGDPGHLTHSLIGVLYELGGLPAYHVAQVGSLLVVGFLALRGAWRATSLEATARAAAIFYVAFGLVAAPWFQAWYISWIPPLLLINRQAARHRLAAAPRLAPLGSLIAADAALIEVTAVWSALALVQYAVPWHTATAVVVNGVPLLLLLLRGRIDKRAQLV